MTDATTCEVYKMPDHCPRLTDSLCFDRMVNQVDWNAEALVAYKKQRPRQHNLHWPALEERRAIVGKVERKMVFLILVLSTRENINDTRAVDAAAKALQSEERYVATPRGQTQP